MMKRKKLTFVITALIAFSLLIGCGGGGGGGDNTGGPAKPTQAVVKVGIFGFPSSFVLGAAQATIHLPTGVWVATNAGSTVTSANVVVASGIAASPDTIPHGVYSSATNTLGIYIIKADGFSDWQGEFATVTCNISPAASPQSSDFTVTDLVVSDTTGYLVSGLTQSWTVTFQ